MSARLLALGLMLTAVSLSGQQSLQPGSEHKRLHFFVGEWKFEGAIKDSPFGPAGTMTGTEKCEWFEGGFHVVCRGERTVGGSSSRAMSILGYDANGGVYTRYSIGSSGEGGFAVGRLDGKVWRWEGVPPTGEQKGIPARFHWTETSSNSFAFAVELRSEDKPFVPVLQGKATRVN